MGIALVRLPAYKLNLVIYAGRICQGDGVRFYSDLDVEHAADAPLWLTYFDEDADFSGIPVTAYPEAKHVMAPKLQRLAEHPDYRSAVVCISAHCQSVTHFWIDYAERDPGYVSRPVVFTNLKDACDWLKLPDAGCAAVAEAIRAHHAQPGANERSEREGEPRPGAKVR